MSRENGREGLNLAVFASSLHQGNRKMEGRYDSLEGSFLECSFYTGEITKKSDLVSYRGAKKPGQLLNDERRGKRSRRYAKQNTVSITTI